MSFSYVRRTGTGVTTAFTFSFEGQDQGYIREADIVVIVDGTEVPFTLLSTNTLELEDAPEEGADILIRRVMPKDVPFADFTRGNNFGQEILNNSFLQLLYVVHELLDGWFPEGFTVREAVTYLETLRAEVSDPNDPKSVINFEVGDDRYLRVSGGDMEGDIDMDGNPIFVRVPVFGNEPARKSGLDSETSARQSAISSIQSQISGDAPLPSSAFSVISWHDQELPTSVSIPTNKNAWSFGPVVTIAEGQSITIGEGSFWTIANGQGETHSLSYDGGEL